MFNNREFLIFVQDKRIYSNVIIFHSEKLYFLSLRIVFQPDKEQNSNLNIIYLYIIFQFYSSFSNNIIYQTSRFDDGENFILFPSLIYKFRFCTLFNRSFKSYERYAFLQIMSSCL